MARNTKSTKAPGYAYAHEEPHYTYQNDTHNIGNGNLTTYAQSYAPQIVQGVLFLACNIYVMTYNV